MNLLDFARPVQTDAEKGIFHDLYPKPTSKVRTDWVAFTQEFKEKLLGGLGQTRNALMMYT